MVKNFTIIMPVYNESNALENVLKELKDFIDSNKEKFDVEVICINDCSTDNSKEILEKVEWIKLINHNINKGYGASIKTGLKYAKYDTVVIMDSDGQHNPQEILKLLKYYTSPDVMVIGKRKINETLKSRLLGKVFIKFLVKYLFHNKIEDVNSGFRIFSKNKAMKFLHLCSNRFSFSTSITLAYFAYSNEVIFVPINVRERQGGSSSVNILSGFRAIMKILQIAMIYNPLKITFPIFIIFVLCGLFSLTMDLIEKDLSDSTVLFICVTAIFFIFVLISEQIKTIKIEIMEKLKDFEKKNK